MGKARTPLALAAQGWGGHNQVFQLVTTSGSWAIKRRGRQAAEHPGTAFAIEMAAHRAGIPSAEPVPATDGRCWAEIGGAEFRCHRWIEGTAKENEETSATDAGAMGAILARLHGLSIPFPPPPRRRAPDTQSWRELAAQGQERRASWASRLWEATDELVLMGTQASPAELGGEELVGSHRDLNAHNVLFSSTGLHLIDWDAAGPAWPRWERANFAVLWGERGDGQYEDSVIQAFLRGYRDAGGVLDEEDAAALSAAPAALVPWVLQNVELAIAQPSEDQDALTGVLVEALLAMPQTVVTRQAALARCLARL